VPKSKNSRLAELFSWLFGTESQPPVITDSRQLDKLGEVLASKSSLEHIRISRQLDSAYELSEGEEKRLIRTLEKASFYLDEALKVSHRHKNDKAVEARVIRCCESLNEIAKHFSAALTRFFKNND